MLILSKAHVQQALPMREMIGATKEAYAALSSGKAAVPQRIHLSIPPHAGISLFMPAYLEHKEFEALAIKTVSVFPNNAERGLPIIHGAVLVLEADTGRPIALLEGGSITAIRTGAASGAATDILAAPDCEIAAILGAGIQSRTQLEAICTVRQFKQVLVYDPQPEVLSKFIGEMAGRGPIPTDLQQVKSPQEAVSMADVICCATTSDKPIFEDQYLKPGVHINGVGSFTPDMQEIPGQTVKRAALFVDSRTAVLKEAGDIIQPLRQGLIDEDHIQAELGEVINGIHPGRIAKDQITFFKSVGNAVQDAVAARVALENAGKLGLGQVVQL
jgi:alanine dehydrogenase